MSENKTLDRYFRARSTVQRKGREDARAGKHAKAYKRSDYALSYRYGYESELRIAKWRALGQEADDDAQLYLITSKSAKESR